MLRLLRSFAFHIAPLFSLSLPPFLSPLSSLSLQARELLVPDEMKRLVEGAQAIHLVTDTITYLNNLLYNTPEEKFVQMQLKAVCRSSFLLSYPILSYPSCLVMTCP